MRTVERHDHGRTNISEQMQVIDGILAEALSEVDQTMVNASANFAGIQLGCHLWGDPLGAEPETQRVARITVGLKTAWCLSSSLPEGGEMTMEIEDHSITVLRPISTFGGLSRWLELWSWQRLSRSDETSRAIRLFDTQTIIDGGVPSAYRPVLHMALRRQELGDPDWTDDLHLARNLVADPMKEDASKAKFLDATLIELLLAITDEDQDRYTATLEAALRGHKRYWTQTRRRKESPHGFFALSVAAAVTIAHDHGLTTEVASDYLPTHLIAPGWYPAPSG